MRIAGIVCEYNPFHNGHAYHIARTREMTGCDAVVCVMSGSFVQRGEIAMYDKWTRARWALQNGADLVAELPSYYVLQSADVFARGGVNLLSELGADTISFGSESGDLELINRLAGHMCNEDDAFRASLGNALATGMGYPAAYAHALAQKDAAFSAPIGANDLLGAAYLRAIREAGYDMTSVAVQRKGALHDGAGETDGFASASALREQMLNGVFPAGCVPWTDAPPICDMSRLESLVLGTLRTCSTKDFQDVPGMEEGLVNRLQTAAAGATSLEQFWSLAASKRYTRSRIRRVVLCMLLGIRRDMILDSIRVLGFTPTGAKVLRQAGEKGGVPLVVKTADRPLVPNGMSEADIRATDLAALCGTEADNRRGGNDYRISPVMWGF